MGGGGALPSFDVTGLAFNAATGVFSLESTDNGDANTYTIEFNAELPDGTSATETFDLTLTECQIVPAA